MGLYESLGLVVADMIRTENPYNIQIGGPIMLLQLWLNATCVLMIEYGFCNWIVYGIVFLNE